jgi:hypothetical protein
MKLKREQLSDPVLPRAVIGYAKCCANCTETHMSIECVSRLQRHNGGCNNGLLFLCDMIPSVIFHPIHGRTRSFLIYHERPLFAVMYCAARFLKKRYTVVFISDKSVQDLHAAHAHVYGHVDTLKTKKQMFRGEKVNVDETRGSMYVFTQDETVALLQNTSPKIVDMLSRCMIIIDECEKLNDTSTQAILNHIEAIDPYVLLASSCPFGYRMDTAMNTISILARREVPISILENEQKITRLFRKNMKLSFMDFNRSSEYIYPMFTAMPIVYVDTKVPSICSENIRADACLARVSQLRSRNRDIELRDAIRRDISRLLPATKRVMAKYFKVNINQVPWVVDILTHPSGEIYSYINPDGIPVPSRKPFGQGLNLMNVIDELEDFMKHEATRCIISNGIETLSQEVIKQLHTYSIVMYQGIYNNLNEDGVSKHMFELTRQIASQFGHEVIYFPHVSDRRLSRLEPTNDARYVLYYGSIYNMSKLEQSDYADWLLEARKALLRCPNAFSVCVLADSDVHGVHMEKATSIHVLGNTENKQITYASIHKLVRPCGGSNKINVFQYDIRTNETRNGNRSIDRRVKRKLDSLYKLAQEHAVDAGLY